MRPLDTVYPAYHPMFATALQLVVELKNTVEDTDLVVTQRLLVLAVEGEEGLQFGLLVGVGFVVAEDVVKQLGDGPRDRS